MTEHDPVNHPKHYTSHPSGVEVIEYSRLLPFGPGSAVKYIMRRDLKEGTAAIQNIDKAIWFLNDTLKAGISYPITPQMEQIIQPVIEAEPSVLVKLFLSALYLRSARSGVWRLDITDALDVLEELREEYL